MATKILINAVTLTSGLLWPGSGFDTVTEAALIATIEAVGGQLYDGSDQTIADAAALSIEMKKRGVPLEQAEDVMRAAVLAQQTSSIPGLIPTTATASTQASGTATTGVTAAGASHTHAAGAAELRHEAFKLPQATGTDLSTATAKADAQAKAPSAHLIVPRNVQLATSGWTSSASVDVTVTGMSPAGIAGVTETITVVGAGTTVQGSKAWLDAPTITSWTTPAGWTAGTFKMQAGTKLGLIAPAGATSFSAKKEVGYTDALPVSTHAAVGTIDATNGTYVPTTGLDGLNDVEVWYAFTPPASGGSAVTVSITDPGHAHVGVAHTHALA